MKQLFLILLFPFVAFCSKQPDDGYNPWYQGVINATSASNVLPGNLCIQPYLTFTTQYGSYRSNWSLNTQGPVEYTLSPSLFVEWGVTDWLDFNIMPSFFTNWEGDRTSTHFGDTYTALGLQILNAKKYDSIPDLRLIPSVIFPTGRFEEADVPQFVTDFTGMGAVQYGVVISAAKKIFSNPMHPWRITGNLGYSRSAPVKVNGFSVYGGGRNARGTVNPGDNFTLNLSLEYSVTQKFTLACENIFNWFGKTTFEGFDGGAPVGAPEIYTVAFCPEIEYSFTPNQGFVGGLWWHYAGKSSAAFIAPVISYCYVY